MVASEYSKYVSGESAIYRVIGQTGGVEVGGLGFRTFHGGVDTEHARYNTCLSATPDVWMSVERHTHQSRAATRNSADPDYRNVSVEVDQFVRTAGRSGVVVRRHGAGGDVDRLFTDVDERSD